MPRRLGKVVDRIWLTAVCGREGDIAVRGVIMSPRPAVFFEAWPLAISLRETTSKEGMAGTHGGEERLGFERHDPTAGGGTVPGVLSAPPVTCYSHGLSRQAHVRSANDSPTLPSEFNYCAKGLDTGVCTQPGPQADIREMRITGIRRTENHKRAYSRR